VLLPKTMKRPKAP